MGDVIILFRFFRSKIGWLLRYPVRHQKALAMRKFKGIHAGERCFIIATGPSLTLKDVERLRGETTFSVNSITGFFDMTDWRPTYYGVIDANAYSKVDRQKLKDISAVFYHSVLDYPYENGYSVPLILSHHCYHNTMLQKKHPLLFPWTKFSSDITKCVYDGRTVVYAMIQIAVYMGFSEIYLLGADCNYHGKQMHSQHLSYENKSVDPDVGDYMIECYRVAKSYADNRGIKIYNATRGGMLEVFERVDLDTLALNDI